MSDESECAVLSTAELARRWDRHPVVVRRAVAEGRFPVKPIPGLKPWRFSLASIRAIEAEGAQTKTES